MSNKDFSKELAFFVKPQTKIFNLLLNDKKLSFKVFRIPKYTEAIYTKNIIINSLILCFHPQVREDLKKVREHLGINIIPIKHVYKDKAGNKLGSFVGYASRVVHSGLIDNEKLDKTYRFAGGMAQRYKLNLRIYQRSLEIYLLTDKFPIPIDFSKFRFISSGEVEKRWPTKDISFLDGSEPSKHDYLMLDMAYSEYAGHSAIQLNGKINSKNEFFKWVTENWDEIKKDSNRFKETKRFEDLDVDKFACGLWLWNLKENNNWNWNKIEKKISEITDKDDKFWGPDEDRYPPDRTKGAEFISSAKSYMKSFLASDLLE